MTRAKDISKIVTDADLSGTLDVTGAVTAGGLTMDTGGNSNHTLEFGANRTSDSQALGIIRGSWNSTVVSQINLSAGDDTTNKDNGQIFFRTAEAGTTANRLRIEENGDISFYEDTGTTPKLFWDASAESLGIGTASPANALHVKGVTTVAYIESTGTNGDIQLEASGTTGYTAVRANNNDLAFLTNTAERMRINSDGNVLIGRTSELNDFGDGRTSLVLQGTGSQDYSTIQLGNNGTASNTQILGILAFYDGTENNARVQAIRATSTDSADLLFWTRPASGSLTERMRIDSSGRVGIGTSSPDNLLHLSGGSGTTRMKFTRNNTADTGNSFGELNFENSVGTTLASIKAISMSGNTESGFVFGCGGGNTERMRIDSSGNVMIGTTVTGNAGGITMLPNNSAGAGTIVFDRSSTSNISTVLLFENGNSPVGSITHGSGGTNFNTTSDHRLKENVVAMADATTRLKQLQPKRFNFMTDADTTVDGFLAHEVQSVVPEAITGTHNEVDADGDPVYQGIDQSKLVPLLVKTIQELEARIVALETA